MSVPSSPLGSPVKSPPRYFVNGAESDSSDDEVQENVLTEKRLKEIINHKEAVVARVSFKNALAIKKKTVRQEIALNWDKSHVKEKCVELIFSCDKTVFFSNNYDGSYSRISIRVNDVVLSKFSLYNENSSLDGRLKLTTEDITETELETLRGPIKRLFSAPPALSAFQMYKQNHSGTIVKIIEMQVTLPISNS